MRNNKKLALLLSKNQGNNILFSFTWEFVQEKYRDYIKRDILDNPLYIDYRYGHIVICFYSNYDQILLDEITCKKIIKQIYSYLGRPDKKNRYKLETDMSYDANDYSF